MFIQIKLKINIQEIKRMFNKTRKLLRRIQPVLGCSLEMNSFDNAPRSIRI